MNNSVDGLNVDNNVIEQLREYNDMDLNRCIRKLFSLNKIIAKANSSKVFLTECKKYGLIPKFIKNCNNSTKEWFNDNDRIRTNFVRTTNVYHQKILNIHISYHSSKSRKNIQLFKNCVLKFKEHQHIPVTWKKTFTKVLFNHRKTLFDKFCKIKSAKLDKIKRSYLEHHKLNMHDKWFVNLTDTAFPLEFKWLLSLGDKFALPIQHFPLLDLIVDVEECLRTVNDEHEKEIIR